MLIFFSIFLLVGLSEGSVSGLCTDLNKFVIEFEKYTRELRQKASVIPGQAHGENHAPGSSGLTHWNTRAQSVTQDFENWDVDQDNSLKSEITAQRTFLSGIFASIKKPQICDVETIVSVSAPKDPNDETVLTNSLSHISTSLIEIREFGKQLNADISEIDGRVDTSHGGVPEHHGIEAWLEFIDTQLKKVQIESSSEESQEKKGNQKLLENLKLKLAEKREHRDILMANIELPKKLPDSGSHEISDILTQVDKALQANKPNPQKV